MMDSMYMVLPPEIDTLEELEYWHNKFMQLTYDQRRTSNDISIAQFGSDNITRYNKMRADFFNNNDFNQAYNNLLSYFKESVTQDLFTNNFEEKMDRVKAAEEQGLVIMIPNDIADPNRIDQIRAKWDKFNSLSTEQRNLSDQTALSIFGVDNYNLYNRFLNEFLEDSWKIKDHQTLNPSTYYKDIRTKDGDWYEGKNLNVYYTPEEMGNSKSSSALVSESGKILDTYKWVNELTNLTIQLKYTNDKNKINSIKEQIHNLWWNPEIPFSLEAASKTHFRKGFNVLTESANSTVDIYTLAQKML